MDIFGSVFHPTDNGELWDQEETLFLISGLRPVKPSENTFITSPSQVSSLRAWVQFKSDMAVMSNSSSAACHPVCLEHCMVIAEEFKACTASSSLFRLLALAEYHQHWLVVWYTITLNRLFKCFMKKTKKNKHSFKNVNIFYKYIA